MINDRKHIIILLFISLFFYTDSIAQFKINDTLAVRVLKSTFSLDDQLIGLTTHNDKGFIVFRGKEKYITHDSPILNKTISYYTDSLTLNWKLEIPSIHEIGTEINRIVTSKKYIYHLSTPIYPGKPPITYFTQIDAYTGFAKSFEFDDNEDYRIYFTDDEAIKFIRVRNDSLYELISINHTSFEKNTLNIKLPSIKSMPYAYANFRWIYFGNNTDHLYFYKKIITKEITKKSPFYTYFEVLEYDIKKQTYSTFKIEPTLSEGNYIVPSNNYHVNQIKHKETYRNKVSSVMEPVLPSLGDLYFNEDDQSILVFAQYGKGICNEESCNYKGILVEKYSNIGDLVFTNQIDFPDSIRALDPKLTKLPYNKFSRRLVTHTIDKKKQLIKYQLQIKDKSSRKSYLFMIDYKTGQLVNTENRYNTKKEYFTDITHYDDHFTFERSFYSTNKFYFNPKFHSLGDLYFAKRSTVPEVKFIATLELFKIDVGELLIEYFKDVNELNIYHITRHPIK